MWGSFGELCVYPKLVSQNTAMTTIGAAGTEHGFILGADGRMRLDDESRAKAASNVLARETDYAQKIFLIEGRGHTVALAMAGSVANNDLNCDLVKEAKGLSLLYRQRSFRDHTKFVNGFCSALTKHINAARHFPKLHKAGNGWTILDLIMLGYVNHLPFLSSVNIHHRGSFAEFTPNNWPIGFCLLYGSDRVRQRMYDNNGMPIPDSPFKQYVMEMKNRTLDEAEQRITGYIEACKSPLAFEIDAERCKFTGGHVHIAEITPSGFRWRISPRVATPEAASQSAP